MATALGTVEDGVRAALTFDPFAEMRVGDEKVRRLADPLARALLRWW